MKKIAIIVIAICGLLLTGLTYFRTSLAGEQVGVIVDKTVHEVSTGKTVDEYKNHDERWLQTLHVRVLSGKHRGKTYRVHNSYASSQLLTQRYRPHQRVLIGFVKGRLKLLGLKRDWVLVLALTLFICLLTAVASRHTVVLLVSMALNWLLFYGIVCWDIAENGTQTFLIYGTACLGFAALSLLLAQGWSRKMLLTLAATLVSSLLAFLSCYLIMKVTHESGIKYEAVEYATQNPRSLFLAQTMLGLLGAVMDEATDLVTSLQELAQQNPHLSKWEFFKAGCSLGQDIMGPLINVLVLIFMAAELPMTILYLRDNNTLHYTFQFALSLGIIQSLISAVGIVINVPLTAAGSMLFLHPGKEAAK